MADTDNKPIKAHCPDCSGVRNAHVRAKHSVERSHDDGSSSEDLGMILECCGCERVYFRRDFWFSEWENLTQHPVSGEPRLDGGTMTSYWPPPIERKPPEWMRDLDKNGALGGLLSEMYSALEQDLRVLAAIAARTVFDCASEVLEVDPGLGLGEKLDTLHSRGKIGAAERETLSALVDAGSAAAHRGWKPADEQLITMITVLEDFLYRSFVVEGAITKLKASVPPKPPRPGRRP